MNKHARHNLCFDDEPQEPGYENKKGRIIAYNTVPLTSNLRDSLRQLIGAKATSLTCEGNKYYNVKECGIGFHEDSERRKVIAVRLRASLPLHYQWFKYSAPIGRRGKYVINHRDLYIMSEKAVGTDWKRKKIPTLRHAAGCKKFLDIKN